MNGFTLMVGDPDAAYPDGVKKHEIDEEGGLRRRCPAPASWKAPFGCIVGSLILVGFILGCVATNLAQRISAQQLELEGVAHQNSEAIKQLQLDLASLQAVSSACPDGDGC